MTLIMVVEDDQDLAEMLGIVLNGAGYEVDLVSRGDEAMEVFRAQKPDLVLMDVMLPGIDGVEIVRQIRTESMVPIVMLTARIETPDKVAGLEAGADDYMVKPFEESELLARLKVRLRRAPAAPAAPAEPLKLGSIVIDQVAHTINRDGKVIPLTRLEFDLLVALAKDPGRVFTREALLSEVWGYQHAADTRLVNVHIQRLRAKVEYDPENPDLIVTVRGIGYKAGQN
jgi:two-component system, OmpR family, response regulator MtrA